MAIWGCQKERDRVGGRSLTDVFSCIKEVYGGEENRAQARPSRRWLQHGLLLAQAPLAGRLLLGGERKNC